MTSDLSFLLRSVVSQFNSFKFKISAPRRKLKVVSHVQLRKTRLKPSRSHTFLQNPHANLPIEPPLHRPPPLRRDLNGNRGPAPALRPRLIAPARSAGSTFGGVLRVYHESKGENCQNQLSGGCKWSSKAQTIGKLPDYLRNKSRTSREKRNWRDKPSWKADPSQQRISLISDSNCILLREIPGKQLRN